MKSLAIFAPLISALALAGTATGASNPHAQTYWRLAVATWTAQAHTLGKHAECGPNFLIFPQCNFGTVGTPSSSFRVSPDYYNICAWNITVYRHPDRPDTHPPTVKVNICKPGWRNTLPRPS